MSQQVGLELFYFKFYVMIEDVRTTYVCMYIYHTYSKQCPQYLGSKICF